MSEDSFYAVSAPTVATADSSVPAGWRPPAPVAAPPSSETTVTMSTSVLVALGACVASALACIGAWGPWFTVSLLGVSANFGGLNSHLHGRDILVIGFVGVVLGMVLTTVPKGAGARTAIGGVLMLMAVVGLAIVVHQYVHLSNAADQVSDLGGSSLGVHAGAGWGLWLDGISLSGMGLAGLMACSM